MKRLAPSHLLLSLACLAGSSAAQSTLDTDLTEALGVSAAQVLSVRPVGELGQPLTVVLDTSEGRFDLELEPHSVRAPDFELRVQGADGSWTRVDPGPERTLRGTLRGLEGSRVAASWNEDGLYARVILADGSQRWLQPLGRVRADASADQHVWFRQEDILAPEDALCGVDSSPAQQPHAASGSGAAQAAGTLFVAEVSFDTDVELYNSFGSSATAVMNHVTSVINTMNLQYETQVQITHRIGTILIRTTGGAPYNTTNPNTLLTRFRDEWNNNQGSIQRDVAHYFTGKNLDGSVIGIAYVGVICTSSAYGIVQDYTNNFACLTDLSAHELGHNWSAGHCVCPTNTMNPSITCANDFLIVSQAAITSHRDTRGCLDDDSCPDTSNYCAAGTHSGGQQASLSSSGSRVVSDNAFTIQVSDAAADKFGLFFYGDQQGQTPFGDGFRCVTGNIFRVNPLVQTDGSGDAARTLDLTSPPSPSGQISAGSTWSFQFWFRDPMGPGGSGFNLSDGLEVPFCD